MSKAAPSFLVVESLEDIPPFHDEGEEAEFWSTHRLSEALLDHMRPPDAESAPPARTTRSITLRIDEGLLARLQVLAAQRQIPYQRLLKQFVQERLQEEEGDRETDAVRHPTALATGETDPEALQQTARAIARLASDLEAALASRSRP